MLIQIFYISVFLLTFHFSPLFLCTSIPNNWISPLTVGRGKAWGKFLNAETFRRYLIRKKYSLLACIISQP